MFLEGKTTKHLNNKKKEKHFIAKYKQNNIILEFITAGRYYLQDSFGNSYSKTDLGAVPLTVFQVVLNFLPL